MENHTHWRPEVPLNGSGYFVHRQTDGMRLHEAASSFRPDLAILDLTVPRPNGMSLARRLRAGHDLHILFVTEPRRPG